MSERLPIPEALRRRILVESGHRCSIHTCCSTEVDVHHIIPWNEQPEHRYENLIALCPNCHRLAERGKIDRKSLKMYKARVSAAFNHDIGGTTGNFITDKWIPTAFV
jgi:5-methylcytosine-specific restriction endonuclease McrA